MKRTVLIGLLSATLLGGCSLVAQKRAEIVRPPTMKGQGELITLPAQLRIVTTHVDGNKVVTCSEPIPDVAMSDTFHMISELANKGTGAAAAGATAATNETSLKNDLATATTAMELAGRTQIVLLAREFLFRTCEARANGWTKDEQLHEAQGKVITEISQMIRAEKERAQTDKIKAITELSKTSLSTAKDALTNLRIGECDDAKKTCVEGAGQDVAKIAACETSHKDCVAKARK